MKKLINRIWTMIKKNSIWYNLGIVVTLVALFFCVIKFLMVYLANDTEQYIKEVIEFEVSPVFCDNMVFQQNEEIKVWGTSPNEGSTINAQLGDSYGSDVVEDGEWEITFAPRIYSAEPMVLQVYGGAENDYISFENVRIGDVWWVAGQSNIEFTSSASSSWKDFTSSLTGNENVYLYELNKSSFTKSKHDRWRKMNEYSSAATSALACFTYKMINDSFNNEIPIGIIITGYSGAELSSFMPGELTADAPFAYERSNIYDDVLKHTVDIPIKGMVWYQGESDASVYSRYSEKMTSYIDWLREEKNQSNYDFPVYAVELTPCFYDANDPLRQYIDYGEVRGETGLLCAEIDNFYVCPTSDLWDDRGYSNNLHPDNKMQIAQRLSSMILAKEYQYGNTDMYFGPQLEEYSITEDEKSVTLKFDQPIMANNLSGFLLIGEQWKKIEDANIEIVAPDTITINSNTEIKLVRYNTKTDNVFGKDVFLCNGSGLPAPAFSITFQSLDDDNLEQAKKKNAFTFSYKYIAFLAMGLILILGIMIFAKIIKK